MAENQRSNSQVSVAAHTTSVTDPRGNACWPGSVGQRQPWRRPGRGRPRAQVSRSLSSPLSSAARGRWPDPRRALRRSGVSGGLSLGGPARPHAGPIPQSAQIKVAHASSQPGAVRSRLPGVRLPVSRSPRQGEPRGRRRIRLAFADFDPARLHARVLAAARKMKKTDAMQVARPKVSPHCP
jgi:hypothetical protein